jgi:hypothetical protein
MRYAVELSIQCVGWALLAIGAGSLFLLATTGSAPALGSVPLALTVSVVGAVLIWVTRRSLYKKQYRDH